MTGVSATINWVYDQHHQRAPHHRKSTKVLINPAAAPLERWSPSLSRSLGATRLISHHPLGSGGRGPVTGSQLEKLVRFKGERKHSGGQMSGGRTSGQTGVRMSGCNVLVPPTSSCSVTAQSS